MSRDSSAGVRSAALARASEHSPFLRESIVARPEIADSFVSKGAAEAAATALRSEGDDLSASLRRRRQGLALAVALGDLAGELALEQVTRLLSDFADGAIDEAVRAALAERVADADPRGFAIIAMGKLGSHELNYSSDVDLLLLFDPETLPRRSRDDPGEAAVRIGRRLIELLQKRTEDGYVQRVD